MQYDGDGNSDGEALERSGRASRLTGEAARIDRLLRKLGLGKRPGPGVRLGGGVQRDGNDEEEGDSDGYDR